ncbi:MAG: hypothetical protein ACRDGT_01920 [Candidatus Limnocylindria bacterium]
MSRRDAGPTDPGREGPAAPDPLEGLIGRSLGLEVHDVLREPLGVDSGVERERVRFVAAGAERTLLFERMSPRRALEVQLLPFLARKTDRVPAVHARGIPPRHLPAPQWLLLEDLADSGSACDGDVRAVLDAKLEVERAVAKDGPALRALGVRERGPQAIASEIADAVAGRPGADEISAEARECARRIAKLPVALVHGDLRCGSALSTDRGVVLRRWGGAYIGCALLDVVRLVADVVERGEAVLGIGLPRLYAERVGVVLPTEVLRGAERLDRLALRYLDR